MGLRKKAAANAANLHENKKKLVKFVQFVAKN